MAEPVCTKWGQHPREPFRYWCRDCLAASRRWHERYVAYIVQEEMNYVPYRLRQQTPPPPAPEPGGAPQKLCGHCGNTGGWLEREPGQFQCNVCGRTP
jgi:hypothetical protein